MVLVALMMPTVDSLVWIFIAGLIVITLALWRWIHGVRQKHDQQVIRLREELGHCKKIKHRYRRLVETSPDWIWEVDSNGIYTYSSPGVRDLLGLAPEEIIGKTPFDLMPADEAQRIGEIFSELLAEQRPFKYLENKNIHKDGQVVVLETSAEPFFNEENVFQGYHGVDRDITQRKLTEDRLKSESEFINAVLEVAGNVIVVLDRAGKIVRFNRAAEELTGYFREEVTGRPVWEVVIPAEQQTAVRQVFDNLMDGETNIAGHYENHWLTRSSQQRLLDWHNTILRDEQGEISHIVALGYDITEQRANGVEKERLQRELQQAQKMEALGQLTGGIAHDFNNLLGIIMGFSELAQGKLNGEEQAKLDEYLSHVRNAGKRATDLVSQMLTFSRSEQTEDQNLQVAHFLKEDIRMLRSILPSSIEIVTEIDMTLPAILMNPTELHQLIINLSVNARDAMEGQGKLTISMGWVKQIDSKCNACHQQMLGNWVEISVADTGSGIEAEQLEHVFEPFFTTKDVGKGTGMGLAVVFGIVHNHGGHILVETEKDIGTRFRMLFPPVIDEDQEIMDSAETAMEPPVGQGQKIMVVDDEAELGEYLHDQLTAWGFQPVFLPDSSRALEIFQEKPETYSLLILDQTMPGMTGVDLAAKCRELRPDLPVILCSGYSEKIDKQEAERLKVTYLDKPIRTEELIAAINASLI